MTKYPLFNRILKNIFQIKIYVRLNGNKLFETRMKKELNISVGGIGNYVYFLTNIALLHIRI